MSKPAMGVASLVAAASIAVGCGDGDRSGTGSTPAPTPTPTAPVASASLLFNADFRDGTDHWRLLVGGGRRLRFETGREPGRLDVAARHTTKKAGVVEAVADIVPTIARGRYRLSAIVRVLDPTPRGGARQRVKWLDRSNKLLKVSAGRTVPASRAGILTLRDTFTAPAGAVQMIVGVGLVVVGKDRVSFALSNVKLQTG